eukprot:3595311-Prymnesium_polylepis.1
MYVAKPTWCSPAPPSHEPISLATIMMGLTFHAPTLPPCSAAIDLPSTDRATCHGNPAQIRERAAAART